MAAASPVLVPSVIPGDSPGRRPSSISADDEHAAQRPAREWAHPQAPDRALLRSGARRRTRRDAVNDTVGTTVESCVKPPSPRFPMSVPGGWPRSPARCASLRTEPTTQPRRSRVPCVPCTAAVASRQGSAWAAADAGHRPLAVRRSCLSERPTRSTRAHAGSLAEEERQLPRQEHQRASVQRLQRPANTASAPRSSAAG